MPPALSSRGSQQVQVRMDPDMHRAIRDRASQNDRSMAQEVRRAVRLYLASQE
jgi:predicted HicB family RNase H-like nuclease